MKTNHLPELLAPAGSEESLRAALAAGADAVYFGSTAFSNRMRAKNFTPEALRDAIRLTHSVGARAHITVNTRVRDREMDDALRLCEWILDPPDPADRADAVIIADLGLAAEILRRWPHARLHASTQTSMGSLADCFALRDLGFTRLVLPRELSRDEITELCAKSPIEIEIFLHGALCVSCSGQCLLSFACGGRSGNRGECAQPCRLPYRVSVGEDAPKSGEKPTETPLSLPDLCLAGRIPEVVAAGVASLKIEGRLKNPGYVYGVTRIYRRLLDEGRNADRGELAELRDLFSRGFTDGTFTDSPRGMRSEPTREVPARFAAPEDIARDLRLRKQAFRDLRSDGEIAVRAVFTLKSQEPARLRLELRSGEVSAEVIGDVPEAASGAPLTGDAVRKQLVRLGGTGLTLAPENVETRMDAGLWMPVSRLNALRRDAVERLAQCLPEAAPKYEIPAIYLEKSPEHKPAAGFAPWTLSVADVTRLELEGGPAEELRTWLSAFEEVFVPAADYPRAARRWKDLFPEGGPRLCASLPVFPAPLDERFRILRENGCQKIEAHTPGGVRACVEAGFAADVSFRSNVTNREAAALYRKLGAGRVGLSPEVPCGTVRALGGSPVVFGRLPLMTLARCVLSPENPGCRGRGGRTPDANRPGGVCRGALTDRRGEIFPVLSEPDCSNVLYNSTPIWMGDRLGELRGAESLRFWWSTETCAEMRDVADAYRNGRSGKGRRIP